jgi:hypothetical protein
MDEPGTLFSADEPESEVIEAGEDRDLEADEADVDGAEADGAGDPEADETGTVDFEEASPAVPATLDEMVAELTGAVQPAEDAQPDVEGGEAGDAAAPESAPEPVASGPDDAAQLGETATDAAGPAAPEALAPITRRWWTRVPLWIVFAAFPVVTGVPVYLMWPGATGAVTAHPLYRLLVLGGAALVLIGLMTGCAIWLTARSRAADDEKVGLGRTLWMRTLTWTAGGVALWWIGLVILDLRHSGVFG